MKVELSIADDKELRDMIKNMIRNQIVSVTREEIKNVLYEVYEQKYNLKDFNMKDVVDKEIRREVREQVYKMFQSDGWNDRNMLRAYAKDVVNTLIREMFESGNVV